MKLAVSCLADYRIMSGVRCPTRARPLEFSYLPANLRARLIAALTPFFARRARTSAFALDLSCRM